MDPPESRIRIADVLRIRVFAVLYAAEIQSTVGDQLARVALSFLVFERTGSAAATALTYAATYLPAILGGFVLAGIGDRRRRRSVMIGCDAVRAVLFAAMALPHLATPVVIGLLVVAVFLGPAFSASQVSYLAGALAPGQFRVATGLRMVSSQASQVVGFAAGGALVAALGARQSLLVDAATYALSAVVIAVVLRGPAPSHDPGPVPPAAAAGLIGSVGSPVAILWRDGRTRALLALSALAGLFVVPEGLAVPLGHRIGASPTEVGLLLAAIPLGGAMGATALVRLRHRTGAAGWMAIGCGLPLVATALLDQWPALAACWLVSGGLAAYQVEVTTELVRRFPDALRARLIGVASASLLGAQGVGLVVFAGVARLATPGHAIAAAGALGSVFALVLVTGPLRPHPGRGGPVPMAPGRGPSEGYR